MSGAERSVILCTAGFDHTIRFWEAPTGMCHRTLQYQDSQVNRLDITPDKAYLAVAGNPHIRLYDAQASNPNALTSFEGHSNNVTSLGFQKDRKWMFSGSEDGSVKIWDIRVSSCQRDYNARAPVNTVVLHPNQGEMISGDEDGAIRVWDLTANACSLEIVPDGRCPIRSLAIASDASLLLAANNKGMVYAWRLGKAALEPAAKFEAHAGYITKLLLSPDVKLLATCSSDKSVKIWSLDRGWALDRVLNGSVRGHSAWVWDCFLESDGRVLTNYGLLFLDEIERKQDEIKRKRGRELLFGCYEVRTQALLYRPGRLVFSEQPPTHLVELNSEGEDARWKKGSGDYGTEAKKKQRGYQRSSHVSLRITPDHKMYVQQGNSNSRRPRVAWSSTRAYDPVTRKQALPVVKPYRKMQAEKLLQIAEATPKSEKAARKHVRMLACAQEGYQPQSTSQRDGVQSDLHLDDAQFAAFIELLGFWLGDGTMDYYTGGGYVRFEQRKEKDVVWLRETLEKAGLEEDEDWRQHANGMQTTLLIAKPAWFDFFDEEFGVKFRGSRYYRAAAATPADYTDDEVIVEEPPSSGPLPALRDIAQTVANQPAAAAAAAARRLPVPPRPFGLSIEDDEAAVDVASHPQPEVEDEDEEEADGSAAVPIDLTGVSDDEVKRDEASAVIPAPNQPMKDEKDEEEERPPAEDEPVKTEPPDGDEPSNDEDADPDDSDEEELPPPVMQPGRGTSWGPGVQPDPVKSVKWLPAWTLQELSRDEMRLLIRGLHRADGAWATQAKVIYASGPHFSDQLMHALLHCGYSANAGLTYRDGTTNGYKFHDQSKSGSRATFSKADVEALPLEELDNYRPIKATADGWKVSWAVPVQDHVRNSGATACCAPSISCQQGVKRVHYDVARDGRAWCVEVEHKDHLVIAQRAQRDANGIVTKQSRPIVVGNCSFSADSAYLVTGSSDKTAKLWDVKSGDVILEYKGHTKAITAVALNDSS